MTVLTMIHHVGHGRRLGPDFWANDGSRPTVNDFLEVAMLKRQEIVGERGNASLKSAWMAMLLRRLHAWAGVLIAPFIGLAAMTGLFYVWTPQIEDWMYRSVLYTDAQGQPLPLQRQVQAALDHVQGRWPLSGVRPALEPGMTTRVLFADKTLGESERWAVFVDPVTGRVRGVEVAYGTSGALPVRLWSSKIHRQLMAGENGRIYAELAASWLLVMAVGGVYLWWGRRQRHPDGDSPRVTGILRSKHARWGVILFLGLLFLALSGLTWSRFAGANIGQWRQMMGWATPTLKQQLVATAGQTGSSAALGPAQMIDAVWERAQLYGIDAKRVEIRPPSKHDQAWAVIEIDRRWPTQVDAIAIDGRTLEPVHAIAFADFPIAAKLTRWAVDLHMGVMLGWPNQLVLTLVAVGLLVMIVWGYRIWWGQRQRFWRSPTLWDALGFAPWLHRGLVLAVAVMLGWALPVWGVSLALIAVGEAVLMYWRRRY